MLSIVKSIGLQGLNGYFINIEVDISNGMPCFEIVGLPDASIKESKERVRTAIKNSGFEALSKRIIINLAPANIRKEGSNLDFPIAIGVLIASGKIDTSKLNDFLEESIFIGELSLDGNVEKINGILPIAIEAKKLGIKRIVLPKQNAKEAAIVDGLKVLPVDNIKEIVSFLNKECNIEKEINQTNLIKNNKYDVDFSDIKGQENAKRALEISAAGGHNCVLIRRSSELVKLCSQKDYQVYYLILHLKRHWKLQKSTVLQEMWKKTIL